MIHIPSSYTLKIGFMAKACQDKGRVCRAVPCVLCVLCVQTAVKTAGKGEDVEC